MSSKSGTQGHANTCRSWVKTDYARRPSHPTPDSQVQEPLDHRALSGICWAENHDPRPAFPVQQSFFILIVLAVVYPCIDITFC
jgi:hypothetical protein